MTTEAQLYAAMEELIASNKDVVESNEKQAEAYKKLADAEHDKLEVVYFTVFGNPKTKEPGMLEIQRNHQKVIDNVSRANWIVIGAAIIASLTFVWEIVRHVALGLP